MKFLIRNLLKMNIPEETFLKGVSFETIQDSLSLLTSNINYINITNENGFYSSSILKLFTSEQECIDYIIEFITDSDVEIISKVELESNGKIIMTILTSNSILNIENITNKIRICNIPQIFHKILINGLKSIRHKWHSTTWSIDGVNI